MMYHQKHYRDMMKLLDILSDYSDYLYYAMLGLGIFYLLFTIIAKLVNQNRMGVQFPQIRQTSKKMTLSSVRSSQLLGRITELELQVERETGLMKGFPTGSSLCSSATPKGKATDDWRFFPPESPSYASKKQRKKSTSKMARDNSVELTRVTHLSTEYPQLKPVPPGRTGNGANPDYEALSRIENLQERRKHSYTVIHLPNNDIDSDVSQVNNHSLVVNHRPLNMLRSKSESIEEQEEPVYAQIIKRRPTDLSSTSSANLSVTSPYDNVEIRVAGEGDESGGDDDDVFNGESVYQALSECQSAHPNYKDKQSDLRYEQTTPDRIISETEDAEDENPYDGIWMTTTSTRNTNNNITVKSAAHIGTPSAHDKEKDDERPMVNGDVIQIKGYAAPIPPDIDIDHLIMSSAKSCDEIVLQPDTVPAVIHTETKLFVLNERDSDCESVTISESDFKHYQQPSLTTSPKVNGRSPRPPKPPKPTWGMNGKKSFGSQHGGSQKGSPVDSRPSTLTKPLPSSRNGSTTSSRHGSTSNSRQGSTPNSRQTTPISDRKLTKLKEKAIFERYLKFEKPPVITPQEEIIPRGHQGFVSTEENPAPGMFRMSENEFIDDIDQLMMQEEKSDALTDSHFCELCANDVFHVHQKPKQRVISVRTVVKTTTNNSVQP